MHRHRQLCVYVLGTDGVSNGARLSGIELAKLAANKPATKPAEETETAAASVEAKVSRDGQGLSDAAKDLTNPEKQAIGKNPNGEFAAYDPGKDGGDGLDPAKGGEGLDPAKGGEGLDASKGGVGLNPADGKDAAAGNTTLQVGAEKSD